MQKKSKLSKDGSSCHLNLLTSLSLGASAQAGGPGADQGASISSLVQVPPAGRGLCPRASPRLSAVPPSQSSPAVLLTLSLLRLCLKCRLLREAFSDYCVWILFYSAICALALLFLHSSVQFSSVTQSCLTLCDPMASHHQLQELAQTHVYRVSDAIQPSHPLSSPSPPAFFIVLITMLFYRLCLLEWVTLVIVIYSVQPLFQWLSMTGDTVPT